MWWISITISRAIHFIHFKLQFLKGINVYVFIFSPIREFDWTRYLTCLAGIAIDEGKVDILHNEALCHKLGSISTPNWEVKQDGFWFIFGRRGSVLSVLIKAFFWFSSVLPGKYLDGVLIRSQSLAHSFWFVDLHPYVPQTKCMLNGKGCPALFFIIIIIIIIIYFILQVIQIQSENHRI
jgi:hypothetical protein